MSPSEKGVRLGRYELLEPIATGGMAELHLARVTGVGGFERLVVVKRILPQLAADRRLVQMFLDEARVTATLHHANIVQVIDAGEEDGRYFLAMEHLSGANLDRILAATRARAARVPLPVSLALALGACAGLHCAHEARGPDGAPLGLVHRDVSPSNLFVTVDGVLKLLDFGIARIRPSGDRSTTVVRGKIRYMSPEQVRGRPLDRRSDLFSLAVVLWELTTGRRAFTGPSVMAVYSQIVDGAVRRPAAVVPDYPPELEQIVMRSLQRDPEARHQTAAALRADLERFAHAHDLDVSSSPVERFMSELFPRPVEDRARLTPTDRPAEDATEPDAEARSDATAPVVPARPPATPAAAVERETRPLGPRRRAAVDAPAAPPRAAPRAALLFVLGVGLAFALVLLAAFGARKLLPRPTPAPPARAAEAAPAPAAPGVAAPAPPPPPAAAAGAAAALDAGPVEGPPRVRPTAVKPPPSRRRPKARPIDPESPILP